MKELLMLVFGLLVVAVAVRSQDECNYQKGVMNEGNIHSIRFYRESASNEVDCKNKCIARKKRNSDINGVTFFHASHYQLCWCTRNLYKINNEGKWKSKNWKTCFFSVNGGWSAWKSRACSTSCGVGSETFERTCSNPSPAHGGTCQGDDKKVEACNKGPCPVNGGWSEWKTTGTCSTTCGAGTEAFERTCTNPKPQFGGMDCEGADKKSEVCNNDSPCPNECNYQKGVMNEGKIYSMRFYRESASNEVDCKNKCIARKKRNSDINGVTFFHASHYQLCWCTRNLYKINNEGKWKSKNWKTCFLS